MQTPAMQPAIPSVPPRAGRGVAVEPVLRFLLWPSVTLASLGILEPSPSDGFLIGLMLLWFFSGFRLSRAVVPFLALTLIRLFMEILALFPFLTNPDTTSYVFYSFVVTLVSVFYALFFSQNTARRVDILLAGYFYSCLIASVFAYIGYFDIGDTAEKLAPSARALGTFKDPNVMGSYCIVGALYALQLILLNKTRHVVATGLAFLFITGAILLTFSRGSLGALALAAVMMAFFSYASSSSRAKRRHIGLWFVAISAVLTIGMLILISNAEFRDFLFQRAALVQDYDGGETGRFGNQVRSIPMLLDRLLIGFGPLQFRYIFDLEPHNSYISAFANAGVIGGFTFIALVLASCHIGFRLCLKASPYQHYAHVLWPPLFGYFLQSFQIDTDHWRFMYMLLGVLWALEAARMRWLHEQRLAAP